MFDIPANQNAPLLNSTTPRAMAWYFQESSSVEAKEESGHADPFAVETSETQLNPAKIQEV
jgi:hypothetical protein